MITEDELLDGYFVNNKIGYTADYIKLPLVIKFGKTNM